MHFSSQQKIYKFREIFFIETFRIMFFPRTLSQKIPREKIFEMKYYAQEVYERVTIIYHSKSTSE